MKLSLVATLFLALPVFCDPYIVLFRQGEISVTSLDHNGFQDLLETSNHKSVGQLKEWIESRGAKASEVQSLWIVRGATLQLSPDLAKKLEREPWVQGVFADRNRKMIPQNGPSLTAPSLKALGEEPHNLWGLKRIGIPKIAEEFPTINGSGIRVGILDTGIQSKHPELKGKVVQFLDFINGIKNPYDDHGHGTHVAGTIAGEEVGIAKKATLVIGKVFSAVGEGADSTLLRAMQWMYDPDGDRTTMDYPHIVSNSWGADLGTEGTVDLGEFLPYQLALQTWIHGGIIPVFAAGNSGARPNGIPGGLPEPISVGALDEPGTMADFSSRGPNLWKLGGLVLSLLKPDISAPGVKITSAFPGNLYATWDGTSMATPHVTGSIALALQANSKLKFAGVKSLLLSSSEAKLDAVYGYGILNAYQLVKDALQ